MKGRFSLLPPVPSLPQSEPVMNGWSEPLLGIGEFLEKLILGENLFKRTFFFFYFFVKVINSPSASFRPDLNHPPPPPTNNSILQHGVHRVGVSLCGTGPVKSGNTQSRADERTTTSE